MTTSNTHHILQTVYIPGLKQTQ